jgi:hypothetical protein
VSHAFKQRRAKSLYFETLLQSYRQVMDWYSQEDDHSLSINAMDCKGTYVVTGSSGGDVKIINMEHDPQKFAHQVGTLRTKKMISNIAFLDKENILVSSTISPALMKYDLQSIDLTIPTKSFKCFSDIQDFKMVTETVWLAGCRDGSITLVDPRIALQKSFNSRCGSVQAVNISPCQKVIYCGTERGNLLLYDVRSQSKPLKSFKVDELIETIENRLRYNLFEHSEGVISAPVKRNDETTILENFDQSFKESVAMTHFGSKQITNYSIQNIITNPSSNNMIVFHLLNNTVAYFDVILGRIVKIYKTQKSMVGMTGPIKRKPCLLNTFGSTILCVPAHHEIVMLNLNLDGEHFRYEHHHQGQIHVKQSKDVANMMIKRIELSSPPSCVVMHESGKIVTGTGYNTILVLGRKN